MKITTLLRCIPVALAAPIHFGLPAFAQAQEIHLVELVEERGVAAKVSAARVVVGVALAGSATSTKPTVEALLPGDWGGDMFCARWLTADALYWAHGTYRLDTGWPGLAASLPYPTEEGETVGELDLQQMAVGITRGDCRADSLDFAPALWNETYADGPQELLVLVNSRGADEVFVLGGSTIDVTCTAVGSGSTVGFDHVCRIPVHKQAGSLELDVNRIRRGNPDEPVVITVAGVGAP